MSSRLRPGDLVEVKNPEEILATLDEHGTVGALPFMPEMVPMCGRRFHVSKRIVKTCFYGRMSTMVAFKGSDVVTLEELRCSGDAHDGCEKGCMLFWREDWLRRVDADAPAESAIDRGAERLRVRLVTRRGSDRYVCQASELLAAAVELSQKDRFVRALEEVRAGNCGIGEMIRRVAIWTLWRVRTLLLGKLGAGTLTRTPTETLGLLAGERVRVKALGQIAGTLNRSARNRGLFFFPDMKRLCGHQATVKRPLRKLIVDGTGEMRMMRDTVYLEGSYCGCTHVAFGGCPRNEFAYWREIWLQRDDVRSPLNEGGASSTEIRASSSGRAHAT